MAILPQDAAAERASQLYSPQDFVPGLAESR